MSHLSQRSSEGIYIQVIDKEPIGVLGPLLSLQTDTIFSGSGLHKSKFRPVLFALRFKDCVQLYAVLAYLYLSYRLPRVLMPVAICP
jgi:hypothetical protein